MTPLKKILIIIVVVFLGLVTIGIVLLFRQRGGSNYIEPAKVSDINMLWPKVKADQSEVYYFKNVENPGFYKMALADKKEEKISSTLDTPDKVLWSPNARRALIFITYDKQNMEKYGSPFSDLQAADQTPMKWVYDFESKKLSRLDSRIIDIAWMTDDKIIYQLQKDNQASINISDYDGQNWEKVVDSPAVYIDQIISFANDKLYFLATPGEGIRNFYVLDIKSKDMSEKLKDVGGSAIVNNDLVLIEISQDNVTQLYWADLKQPDLNNTKIIATVQKAVWLNQDKFLVAIGGGRTDKLIIEDIVTGETRTLSYSEKEFSLDTQNLVIIDKTVYFTSNNVLYKLDLSKKL